MMKESVEVLRIVCDFLDKRSEDDLALLRTGKAKLKLEYQKEKTECRKADLDLGKILKEIESCETTEAAKKYFSEKKFDKAALRQIAESNHVSISSKDTNEQITNRIVERLIGSKMKYDALLNMDLK